MHCEYICGLLVKYFHLTGDLVLQLITAVAERLSGGEGSRYTVRAIPEVSRHRELCSGMLCGSCLREGKLIEMATVLFWLEGKMFIE